MAPPAMPSLTAQAPSRPPAAPSQPPSATAAKSRVEQLQRNYRPTVFTPLNVDKYELELVNHPDRSFVYTLINAIREGTPIGYLGPPKNRVSRNLISASQHPEVVSANLNKIS